MRSNIFLASLIATAGLALGAQTAHAQLIDTAPTPTATQAPGGGRGFSVKIQTSTQVFITRIDAEITPPIVGLTNLKFVIWDAKKNELVLETESQVPLLMGRHFHRSPALAFNTIPGGEYVISLLCSGACTFHTDVNVAESANAITTLSQGGSQGTFNTPSMMPAAPAGNGHEGRYRIHGFILNDQDNDNVANDVDNCPFQSNPGQEDADMDGLGDVCDSITNDDDGDGTSNANDNCPFDDNPGQEDTDQDGIGDVCDATNNNDIDNDGKPNVDDNCPFHENPGQEDTDQDGVGDECDGSNPGTEGDTDGDGVDNDMDNCPAISNPSQNDQDGDGRGDECDLTIIVDGSGCSTTQGAGASFALILFGLVLALRRRTGKN